MNDILHSATTGRTGLGFADESEIDGFVEMLGRFERGELEEKEWRMFRLVNGTYGQRQLGDDSMVRAKLPQGALSAGQMRTLAEVSEQYSRGFCHVTTRQNVQFHFVSLAKVADAMRALAEVGITTREACGNAVRNVTCSPLAGVAVDEVFDVTAYAEALTRYLLRHPLSATLPRKFKIAFSGGGSEHAFAAINDLGWHAVTRDEGGVRQRGFLLTVAGGTATLCRSGRVLFEFLPASELLAAAEAVLRVFHRRGDREHRHRNRMKFLVGQMGWERFRDEVLREYEGIRASSPPRLPFDADGLGEESTTQSVSARRSQPPTVAQIRSLVTAQTVRGPGIVPRALPVVGEASHLERWLRTNVAPQKQPEYSAVTVTLPLGDVTAGQWRALAWLCEEYSDGSARTTHTQNLLLRWVHTDDVVELHARLAAAGLAQPDPGSIADVVSCPGADSCKLAVTRSRGLARELDEQFATRPVLVAHAQGLSVHVSGCPNGCGLHHVAGIGLQGGLRKVDGRAVPQYFVSIGGGIAGATARFARVVAKVPARRVASAIERLLELHERLREPGESPAAFLARVDPGTAREALADLCVLDATNARPEDFVDLGETAAFRPETTEGECAA